METTDSLTQFFYNIVPGFLFLLGFDYLFEFKYFNLLIISVNGVQDKGLILTFLFLALGLFFGFVFQGFTKFTREHFCLDYTACEKVVKNNDFVFKGVKKNFKKNNLLSDKNAEKEQYIFYLMHNYLEAENKGQLPKFFSLRLAFWSNIFFGTLVLFLIMPYSPEIKTGFIIFIFLTLLYSFHLFKKYLYILYDTILKSFITVTSLNKEGK